MKSVLFWKLLFLHYMCLSENRGMQGNIEDHHSQPHPHPEAETEKHPDKDLDLGYNPKTAHSVMRQSPVVWCICLCWGCIGKESEDEGRPRLGTKELSRQLEMPESPS